MRNRYSIALLAALLAAFAAITFAVGPQSPNFNVPWSVFGGGGGNAASTDARLGATIGQPVIGPAASGSFALGAGYWYGNRPPVVADGDNDGYSAAVEWGTPLCSDNRNEDNLEDALTNDGCPTVGPAEATCTGAVDEDADGAINDGCAQAGTFSEAQFKIGTDPNDPCGIDAWPADISDVSAIPNSLNRVNIRDLQLFVTPTRRIGTVPGDANFSSRYDLVPGRGVFAQWINVADLQNMAFLIPPFYGTSSRAFNGPVCIVAP